MSKARQNTLIVFFVLMASSILFRAAQLQILPQTRLEKRAKKQHEKRIELVGRRGVIRDRNSVALAVSLNSKSIYANPHMIKNLVKTSQALGTILEISPSTLKNKLDLALKKNLKFVWIHRQLEEEQIHAFEKAFPKGIEGIGLLPESRRTYPLGEVARNILGTTSLDGAGIEGAELSFHSMLHGERATIRIPRDALGRPLHFQDILKDSDVSPGEELFLSLDSRLQYSTEKILQTALKEHNAKRATAIVMNPSTGELLTIASLPHQNFKNFSISDPIEPGSVVKPLVVAQAIEKGIANKDTILSGGNGFIKVGNKMIGEADASHRHEKLTVAELIRTSSNVGTVNLAQKIGNSNLYSIYEQVGFTQKTGIELLGESKGLLRRPTPSQRLEWATISFGQGMALTPLQIIQGFSVFASDGYKVAPTILKKKTNENSHLAKVFSAKTVQTMRDLLENVVEQEGTGKFAKVRGVKVAGKTGTAQKVDYENGGYKKGAYWSSFIGFLPSQNPQFLIYVLFDEPQGINNYGGTVAAPVFAKIAEAALRLEQMKSSQPTIEDNLKIAKATRFPEEKKENLDTVPDLIGMSLQDAMKTLEPFAVRLNIKGDGHKVENQEPAPGKPITRKESLTIQLR